MSEAADYAVKMHFPDHGEIYVKGKEVTIRSPKDSFALGIGMIHQHFKLVDVLTAAENIVLGLKGKATVNPSHRSPRDPGNKFRTAYS